jgi:Domain of unknown function (DUF3846)
MVHITLGETKMRLACILRVDGTLAYLPRREPTLPELQKAVGGPIQVLAIRFLNEPGQMIMAEEGKVRGFPLNMKATAIALATTNIARDDYVVGDVVILMGGARLT